MKRGPDVRGLGCGDRSPACRLSWGSPTKGKLSAVFTGRPSGWRRTPAPVWKEGGPQVSARGLRLGVPRRALLSLMPQALVPHMSSSFSLPLSFPVLFPSDSHARLAP